LAVAGSPRENPRSFLGNSSGLVETTSPHLFPLHRTAPSRHIHAAPVGSPLKSFLTAFPEPSGIEAAECAERMAMKEEVVYPSTSPEASINSSTPGDAPPKKKQKRNKPTLSCHECVERKTKVRSCPCVGRCCCSRHGNTCVMTPYEHNSDTTRSAIAPGLIVWRVSSDNQHASTRK
jgi:hypothetical protein